ncbi:family 43 glycosylhydrolase [Halalkalibacter urbisdiaboli]|uniref:family 43 glycosylhydrolase n=1 Tax=Halalkalibacter urbisdiaboli TaxID=1960589 RepID=UPI000B44AE64|nr:family 43 glycosylhydrolase [Halalkalibacter urbisdiaboli]
MNKLVSVAFLLYLLLHFPVSVLGGNPVIQERFSADPAALVHDDKVYLYVGRDQAGEPGEIDHFYVLKEWNVYSSSDMINWELEGTLSRTEFEWAREDTAWASQAIERDGKFYWYVTVLNKDSDPEKNGYAIGVAVSDKPAEGFKDALGKPLISSDMTEAPGFMDKNQTWDDIDPTVFIDDDGQAYLYWGNTHLYYAKLKGNMVEIDGDIERVTIDNMPGTFTEAPYLHKHNETYYLSFAMNFPELTAYATSDQPEGPWEYQGVLLDKMEDSETSHQAILEFKGQWYLIYHTGALPTGGNYKRSTSIEKLVHNDDGTIDKVTPTASGLAEERYSIKTSSQHYIRHLRDAVRIGPLKEDNADFKWHIVSGLADERAEYISFEAENKAGYYLKQGGEFTQLVKNDGTKRFEQEVTFKVVEGLGDSDSVSFQAYNDETLYLYHHDNNTLRIGPVETGDERIRATFQVVEETGEVLNLTTSKAGTSKDNSLTGTIFVFISLIILAVIVVFRKGLVKRSRNNIT